MNNSNGIVFDECPSKGRTRPEGESYAKLGTHGTIGSLLQVEGNNIFYHSQPKRKSTPSILGQREEYHGRNHFSANLKRIRQLQRANTAARQRDAAQPVKAMWKSEKFASVPSKVKMELEREPLPPRPSSADFLRAHSRTGGGGARIRSRTPSFDAGAAAPRPKQTTNLQTNSNKPPRPASPQVSRPASALDVELERRNIDFLKLNCQSLKLSQQQRRSPSAMALEQLEKQKTEDFNRYQQRQKGKLPDYLVKRRNEWREEEEERIRQMPDPDQPPGTRLLPDDERRKTLDMLNQNHQKLLTELGKLPLRNDTMRIRQKRDDIESKLAQVEEAVKIFSRLKVFVKD